MTRVHRGPVPHPSLATRETAGVRGGMAKKTLQSEDWIEAGFAALAKEGLGAVRVEPLARSLGVSKGSFYWHFKDLAELQRQMITAWQERATLGIINKVETKGGSANERLENLLGLIGSDFDRPYCGPGTDLAIRAWARLDTRVARAQRTADTARFNYFADLFRELGETSASAETWAKLFHFASRGAIGASADDRKGLSTDLLKRFSLARGK